MIKIKTIYKSIHLLLILFTLLQAHAQIDPKDIINMPINKMMTVNVLGVSRYTQSSIKAPASTLVITEEQIINRGYTDLSEVLKDVIGIDIIDNARGFGENYTINGIDGNDRFLVLINGIKINPPSGSFISIGNSISLSFVKNIEIIYGPASVIYGADAFSGVINIITKNIPDELILSFKSAYGSFNTFDHELTLSKSFNNDFKISGTFRYFKSDGINLIGKDTIFDHIEKYNSPQTPNFEQPINDYTAYLSLKYKNFSFSYFRKHFNEGNSLGTHTKSYIYNKESKWESNTDLVNINYTKKISDNLNLLLDNSYIRYLLSPETQFHKWDKPYDFSTSFNQYMVEINNAFRSSGILNYNDNNKFNIIFGIENEYLISIPPYANDQIFMKSIKFEGDAEKIIRDSLLLKENRFAMFLQTSYSIFNNFELVFGLRYDYSSRFENSFNPRIGIIWSPLKNTTLKGLYGTGFQAPSLFYRYEQWGIGSIVMLSENEVQTIDPNWKLKNQKISNYNITITQKIGDNYLFSISGYYNDLKDLIQRDNYPELVYNKYSSTEDQAIYSQGIVNINKEKQKITGINTSLHAEYSKYISAYTYYSYTDGKIINTQFNIPRIAKHKFWFGITLKEIPRNLTLSLNYKLVGKINNQNINLYPNGTMYGYSNLDLYINYKFLKHFSIFLDINNVFNNNIKHAGLYRQSGGYLPYIVQPDINFLSGIKILISSNNK